MVCIGTSKTIYELPRSPAKTSGIFEPATGNETLGEMTYGDQNITYSRGISTYLVFAE
jgi:hypothetical protein